MPDTSSVRPTTATPPRPVSPLLPALGLVLIVAIVVVALWMRRAAVRAWRRYAHDTHGELRTRSAFSPACLTGVLNGRPFLMETAVSHEDDAPYYHTRCAVPVRNGAGFILGLRRKSLLEEAQTRSDKPSFDLGDPDFERRFFLVCNDASQLPELLTPQLRRELARYPDVEIYARLEQIEWRRAGEVGDTKAIKRLNEHLIALAETIDSLPARPRSLAQRRADEAVIAKGV